MRQHDKLCIIYQNVGFDCKKKCSDYQTGYHSIMSDIFKDRHARLGCIVLKLFPKIMQMILQHYETPAGLKQKYLRQKFCFVFTEREMVLMNLLPNMDEFTIELCYKILRSENWLDEPKCKWGNVPHDIEVEISDDIQRLINATNSILRINSEEVTKKYFEKSMDEIKLIVTRGDSFLQQDVFGSLYNSLRRTDIDSYSILQDLTRIKAIDEAEFLPDTESEKRERYSRLAMAFIDTFPNILRHVIRSNIFASDLYRQCINYIDYFTPTQQENLRQLQYSNTYSSLDVTLICRLLRQFKLIPPPTKGWGAIPDKADTTLADDIERIRCHRNEIAHRCDTNIDTNMFDDYFDKFQNIGRRMDLIFFKKTNFEKQMIGHRTHRIDTKMLKKYENAMKEIENIQLRFTKKPIKFYWGRSFDECLMNLRSLIKEEKVDGKQKVRLQIIFQNENDVEKTIHILNSLKDEINKDLSGIEFIIATKGSIILNVDVLVEMLETDEMLRLTLTLFLAKILESITSSITDSADMVLLPAEEYTHWHNVNTIREPVYLDFDIDAELFVIDDVMEEQISKISYAISKCINGDGRNKDSTATPLPINLESDAIKIPSKPHDRPFEVHSYTPDIQCCGIPTPSLGSAEMGVISQPAMRPMEAAVARSLSPNATISHTLVPIVETFQPSFTISEDEMKVLLKVSQSVGIFYGRGGTGTCWRVGKDTVMTAANVVMKNIWSTVNQFPNEEKYKECYVDFNYNSQTKKDTDSKYVFDLERTAYVDETLDVAVVKLKREIHKEFPPPLEFFEVLDPKNEDEHIYLIGHDKGNKLHINYGIGLWNPTEKRLTDLIKFCHMNGKENGYIGLDRKDRLVIQCKFVSGASGCPGVIIHGDKAYVVLIYTRGYPDFYFSKNFPEKDRQAFPDERLLQQGVDIGHVFISMTKNKMCLNLRNEIFPHQASAEQQQLNRQHQYAIDGAKKSNPESTFENVKDLEDHI